MSTPDDMWEWPAPVDAGHMWDLTDRVDAAYGDLDFMHTICYCREEGYAHVIAYRVLKYERLAAEAMLCGYYVDPGHIVVARYMADYAAGRRARPPSMEPGTYSTVNQRPGHLEKLDLEQGAHDWSIPVERSSTSWRPPIDVRPPHSPFGLPPPVFAGGDHRALSNYE